MKKNIIKLGIAGLALLLSVTAVAAHAVVKPNTAGVGAYTDFTLGVPSEKDASTVSVKLILPAGITSVTPIVKQGWRMEVKQGPVPAGITLPADDDGMVPETVASEIIWSGGAIPSGQKDFFSFSTQVPATPTELDWKIVQTYSDGSTVSWTIGSPDEQPKDKDGKPDFSKFGPYSKTMVVNDLKPVDASGMTQAQSKSSNTLVYMAIVLSVLALGMQFRTKN